MSFRIKSVLFALLSLFFSRAIAQDCGPCEELCPSSPPTCPITPPAGPTVLNGADIFLTGEFLYWTLREDHLAFAYTNGEYIEELDPNTPRGKVFYPDWNYLPGFKVGLGLNFDCDGWDLYANYTWLRERNTKNQAKEQGNRSVVDLNWAVLSRSTTFGSALPGRVINAGWAISQGKWKIDFNVVDLELGRNTYFSPCLKLRPYFGFKGTWQKQWMDVDLFGSPDVLSPDILDAYGRHRIKCWGIGIRAGLDSAWQFTPCFSLIGEVSGTTLWEHFESTIHVYNQSLTTNLFAVDANCRAPFNTIKPVLEFLIGFRWENWFCCDEYHWSIEAGWEEQWWADQNQFISYVNETRQGDLITQGLTGKLRFDF